MIGQKVNLERAMSANSRFGGHIVQGHVDGKGVIKSITKDENGIRIEIDAPYHILKYLVERGSVAVDGISLTVVSLTDMGFTIYIIPETIKNTTLNKKIQGDHVNIEVDILAKYIKRMMAGKSELDKDKNLKEKLFEEGFI